MGWRYVHIVAQSSFFLLMTHSAIHQPPSVTLLDNDATQKQEELLTNTTVSARTTYVSPPFPDLTHLVTFLSSAFLSSACHVLYAIGSTCIFIP